jgi:D-3-phosphoglycerate dehydrogenase
MTLTAHTEGGDVAVAGTVAARREGARLVRILDFDVDIAPARYMAFFHYEDRPGVIGAVGTLLGDAGVNIASMEVGRTAAGGTALMVLSVDSPISAELLGTIQRTVGGPRAPRFLTLPA